MLAIGALVWAQDATGPGAAEDQNSTLSAPQSGAPNLAQNNAPNPAPSSAPDSEGWRRLGAAPAGADPQAPAVQPVNPPPLPAALTIPAGTYFTIRVNQPLNSEHNKVGDLFTATLAKPIIINGFVVAERGETIAGRVSEVEKHGLLKGSSKLGVELTQLTLSDGSQVPLHSQLISISGPGVGGRNVAVVGGTTAVGAAAGAIAGGGSGAAIGAGAGLGVGLLGAVLSKGYPAIIPPEAVLTFSMQQPITVATDRAPQAFRRAGPGDYEQPRLAVRPGPPPRPYYGAGYYGPYPYYGYPYPYYYGPAVGIGVYGRWR